MAIITIGTSTSAAVERGASDDATDMTLLETAIEAARDSILAVPGSGPIRGVWMFNGIKYAFRDDATATFSVMWCSSGNGWIEVDLGKKLNFTSGGTTAIVEGDTIIGETTSASAVVERVILTSGTWAGGDAAGYFVLSSILGEFAAETLKVGLTLNLATVATSHVDIFRFAGGRYEFINENFYGSTATRRMYGCDGVNLAFEFDGTVFCPIATGMTDDAPIHIHEHKKQLFLGFRLGSIQHSAPGEPLVWDVIVGAGEIATGDEITGFMSVPGGLLTVFNRNQTYILYGDDVDNWDLKLHAEDSGAIEWSIQAIGTPRYLDDRGMTSLSAVQSFGDFNAATFSQKIQPLLDIIARNSSLTASIRVRTKDQYRVFFEDGTGIIAKFRPRSIEFTRIDYGMVVRCAASVEDATGREVLMFGSDDGYVYEMDSGTSIDGAAIVGILRLPFGHMKSPQQNKHFYKAVFDVDAPGGTDFAYTHELNYGSPDTPSGITQTIDVLSGGGQWGTAIWGEFIWSGQVVGTADAYIDGDGVNIGMLIRSESIYDRPHTFNGVNIHYSKRGRQR